eukprot:evm.model.scf_2009.2 EVM.evm.TU.scf_2009.2   scf_2009:28252-29187(+)
MLDSKNASECMLNISRSSYERAIANVTRGDSAMCNADLALTCVSQGLWNGARKGSLPEVKKYLSQDADPNFYWTDSGDADCDSSDEICGTSVLAAVFGNKAVVLQSLVDAGADVNFLNGTMAEGFCEIDSFDYGTVAPLYVAAIKNNSFAVEVLLEADAQPDIPCGGGVFSPLVIAASRGTKAVLDLLLAAQPDVDTVDEGGAGDTALHGALKRVAVFEEQNEFVEALLAANACANIPNLLHGDTAVHTAARSGNLRAVELLMGAEGDPMQRNNAGLTPGDVVCISIKTGEVVEGCDGDKVKALLESQMVG